MTTNSTPAFSREHTHTLDNGATQVACSALTHCPSVCDCAPDACDAQRSATTAVLADLRTKGARVAAAATALELRIYQDQADWAGVEPGPYVQPLGRVDHRSVVAAAQGIPNLPGCGRYALQEDVEGQERPQVVAWTDSPGRAAFWLHTGRNA